MRYEACIFDLDGTLLDTIEVHRLTLERTWQALGFPVPDWAEVRKIMAAGHLFWHYWDQLVPPEYRGDAAALERAKDLEERIWNEVFLREASLVPGAASVLRLLHRLGLKLGIVTSSWGEENYVPFRRADVPVSEIFGVVVTREEVKRPKPAPDGLLLALDRLGVPPERAVYVGDAPVDVETARAADVYSIAVLSGIGTQEDLKRAGAEVILPSVAAIPAWLYDICKKECYREISDLFRRIVRDLTRLFREFANRHGVPPTQLQALQKIRRLPGASVSELAYEIGLELSTVSELVDRMEKGGLVVRKKNNEDRRYAEVFLTRAGREVLSKVGSFSAELEAVLEAKFSPAEVFEAASVLHRLVEALETNRPGRTEARSDGQVDKA